MWGDTLAVDGSTVRLTISARGRRYRFADAPAAHGRFYASDEIPHALRGRRIRISARLLP